MVDALSRNVASTTIRDLCLRMTIVSPLLDMIRELQTKGIKEENWKKKSTRGHIPTFVTVRRRLLTI